MSRPIICDECGAKVDPTEYGLPPLGWINVSMQANPYEKPADYCSPKCAVSALAARESARIRRA